MFTEFVHRKNLDHLRRKLAEAEDAATRKTVQNLLDEEIERGERYRAARLRGDDHHQDY